MNAPRPRRVDVDGWMVFDKPPGMTSTRAVALLKHRLNAKKAGHAGTLDPLASGVLPVAFGEATKTVPFVQNGEKAYRFAVRWGAETDSDDSDGTVTRRTDRLPSAAEIAAALPGFTGTIMQVPPAFSAIKINGERAYDIARNGETVELVARPVTIRDVRLIAASGPQATFEAHCGKGTYVRALARDLGRVLGCFGHVTALRRTRVGPFGDKDAVGLPALEAVGEEAGEARRYLLSVEAGLSEVACVVVDRDSAAHLRRGQPLLLRGRDAPSTGIAYAACGGVPVAFGAVEGGELVPSRVFNLPF